MLRMVRIVAFGAFMALFGLVLLIGASVMGRKAVLLWQDTRHAGASVVQSWTEQSGRHKKFKLTYQLHSHSEVVTVDEATWHEARRTKTLAVVYAGGDPRVSSLDRWSEPLLAIVLLIFSLLCLRYAAVHSRKDLRNARHSWRDISGMPA